MTEKDTEIWGESLQKELPSDGVGEAGLWAAALSQKADEASASRIATVPPR